MELKPGAKLGPYEILSPIGEGGMGEVYRAHDSRLGRRYCAETSPEQLQGKNADARSDIFAFGCVLYEMASGRHAFGGASPASVIASILEREPEPLRTAPLLERVIKTCLKKNPAARVQSALDLKRALLGPWRLPSPPRRRRPE